MYAVVAQLVEHHIGNMEVSGSNPDNGSVRTASVAQLVEHVFRKDGVPSSILGGGSRFSRAVHVT